MFDPKDKLYFFTNDKLSFFVVLLFLCFCSFCLLNHILVQCVMPFYLVLKPSLTFVTICLSFYLKCNKKQLQSLLLRTVYNWSVLNARQKKVEIVVSGGRIPELFFASLNAFLVDFSNGSNIVLRRTGSPRLTDFFRSTRSCFCRVSKLSLNEA